MSDSSRWFVLVALLVLLAAPKAGAQAPPHSSLDVILAAITEPSPANLRVAEAAFAGQETRTNDILAQYAMALALVKNNRHQVATQVVEDIPHAVKKSGPLRRLQIWLVFKTNNEELAHAGLQELFAELKTRAAQEPTEKDLEDVRFAARLTCYLHRIADRREPLDAAQAARWWTSLEQLPEAWRAELPEIAATMQAAYDKRKQQMQATYDAWRTKTDGELAKTEEGLTRLQDAEKAAKGELDAARSALQELEAKAKPRLNAIEAEAKELLRQKALIPRPGQPNKPDRPEKGRDGKIDSSEESKYRSELREYEREMQEYRRKMDAYEKRRSRSICSWASSAAK